MGKKKTAGLGQHCCKQAYAHTAAWRQSRERVTAPAAPTMCRPTLLIRLSTRRFTQPIALAGMLSEADCPEKDTCSRAVERSWAWDRNGVGLYLCFAQLRSEPTTNPQDWCGLSLRWRKKKPAHHAGSSSSAARPRRGSGLPCFED